MLRLFEAFSGYGSQGISLKKYGIDFESVGIAEIDKYAIIAHEALHGKVKNYGDVSKLSVDELPDMDLFTYSFPCQDISNAGKQKGLEEGSGTRSSLLWECERIIEGKRPKFLMMENVKNLIGKKNKPHFDRWLNILEELGYNNYWKVINAKNCGIPQNRERVFCVSILEEEDDWLFHFEEDFDNGIRLKDMLENDVDDKYYLSKEKTEKLTLTLQEDTLIIDKSMIGFEGKPREYVEYMPTITAREYKEPRLVVVGNTHPSGKGMNGQVYDANNLAPIITTNKGEGVKIMITPDAELKIAGNLNHYGNDQMNRVYDPQGLSPTITVVSGGGREQKIIEGCAIRGRNPQNPKSREVGLPTVQMLEVNKESSISNCLTTVQKDSMVIENNIKIRKLTPRECFRLMGLSDEEITKIQSAGISNTQQYKLAGNSIVVDCMKFLKNLPT